jgi:HAD superfamily hydrolase (TIGR01509 family)
MTARRAEALLWDLDGVLVDSGRFHYQAYRQMLAERDIDLSAERFFGELIGLRNYDILQKVIGNLSRDEAERLAAKKEDIFRRLVAGDVEPLPGARELVLQARRESIHQAIVSSTPRENVRLILESLELENAFSVIVGEEDAKEGKPDPEGFTNAAVRLAITAADCIVLEDAPEGVQAGKSAGMRVIAVATTREPDRLSEADLVVESLEDERVWRFIEGRS